MPSRHPPLPADEATTHPEIQILLTRIEDEKIPERLLVLARELQDALNRKRLNFGREPGNA